jgi:hypothetical protein
MSILRRRSDEMLSEVPYVELAIFKQDDYTYTSWIDGINGRVDWELFEEFRIGWIEEPCISHPDIKPIINQYDHERDGAITIIAQLVKVDLEAQYGTGEGDVMKLPAYYTITDCKVTKFERLTLDSRV